MKKLFYLLMALPLVLIGCNNGDEPEPTPEPVKPTLELTSDAAVDFTAEGGEGSITYEYTPGDTADNDDLVSDVAQLMIACDAEWIDVATEVMLREPINYIVEANTSTEPREAKIVASYGELSIEVAIRQSAATDEPEPSIEGWGIMGTMNEWSTSEAIVMESVDGYYVAKAVELTTDDKFHFIKDGDNAQNRGGNGQPAEPDYYYTAQLWGSDIHVSVAGTYDIYLNEKEDTYYIMSEGKSPADALKPLAPGEVRWSIKGNFEGGEMFLTADGKYLTATGVKFDGETRFKLYSDDVAYGAYNDQTYNIEEGVAVAESSANDIVVDTEAGVEYDVFFRQDKMKVWVMPAGMTPVIWTEVTGVAFSSTNFGVFMIAEGLTLNFDFNCGVEAENSIIPEGIYYVNNPEGDNGFNFNLDFCDMKVSGFKTLLMDGTMEIKHISGGYDITVDMVSLNQHIIKAHYVGPIAEISIMGRPITNPE